MKKTATAEVVDAPPERTVTSRASDKFILRLPDGMRERLAKVAERQGRSMNAVVVTALAAYLQSEDAAPGSAGYRINPAFKALAEQMANQHQELVRLIKKE